MSMHNVVGIGGVFRPSRGEDPSLDGPAWTAADDRQERIDARGEEIANAREQNLEFLSDSVNDAILTLGWYRTKPGGSKVDPRAAGFLALIRDGSDDAELGRMLREQTIKELRDTAWADAEDEIDGEDDPDDDPDPDFRWAA